jgi:hypothetical protein
MSKRSNFPSPMVMRDTAEYRSPIDGKLISSRSARREDLKRSGCVEYEPTAKFEKGYSNPRFAMKRGLPLNETGMARLEQMKKTGETV